MSLNCELSISEKKGEYILFTITGRNTKNGKEYGYCASISSDTDFAGDRYWCAATFARNALWCLRSIEEHREFFGITDVGYVLKKEYASIKEFEDDDAALIGLVVGAEGFPESLCLKTIEASGEETIALHCYLDQTHDADLVAEYFREMCETSL